MGISAVSVIKPGYLLSPYIRSYSFMRINKSVYNVQRVLPNGCMELMIYQRGSVKDISNPTIVPLAFIGGNMSSYMDLLPAGGDVAYISILFQPYGLKAFFNFPVNEFYNRLTSFEELQDESWRTLHEQLYETLDITRCVQLIECFFLTKLNIQKSYYLDRIATATHMIRNNPRIGVAGLAEHSCLTEKQFKRVFQAYTGCNPKEYIRIARFNKALHMLYPAKISEFAQIAEACGYSDQSHFIREFRAFSGYTPVNMLTPDTGFHYPG